MAALKIFRETVLPGSMQGSAIYLVAPAGSPNYVEMYVTNADGSAARRIIKETDVAAMIAAAAASANEVKVVADIAARNALAPTSTVYVYVRNATGDATVASGGATYLYDVANTAWVKTSESESLDIAVTWSALTGKPASSTSAIDSAVTNSHTHGNKTQLDLIGQDGAGELTYNGALPLSRWSSTAW